ncbi:hypothetical protein R3W88_007868 [Solanum pinnatisectum]|uniref:AAA+ ATPase domain-containing protein n=1 Tax=Solanum pinnatisectum TaxID=50273 RepID=A0AAV9M896_9SOLN|nr:hypothetical protein R3W88_007868 [Solanum pinnatisectum]
MTLGASLVAKTVDYTVAPLGNQLRYLYQYNKNADNLRKQAERLQEKTQDIQALVNYAKRNDREIKSTVKNCRASWQLKKIMTIQELLGRTLTEDVSMPQAPPLNIPFISDQEKPEKDQVIEMVASSSSDVSIPQALPLNMPFISDQEKPEEDQVIEMVASSSSVVSQNVSRTNGALLSADDVSIKQRLTMDPIIAYQLRKNVANIIHQQREAVNQIIEELQDDHYKVIGIYGMGGISKTTLAVEIGKLARDCGIVKEVIMVVVSQTPDIRKIQGLIADMLSHRFEEESTLGRAGRVYTRLSMESVLLILDNVWSYIDLEEIGIPHGDEHKACRILLTTRQKDLCTAMGTKGIPLRLLSEEESSHLLRKNACTSTSDLCLELDGMVMNFVKECQGLPLAVMTVGRALRGKEHVEWKAVLQLLKKSQPFCPTYASKTIFSCLELSYNILENEEIRLVGQLKSSCLLLDVGKEGFVKMHDVVRDFAIYIASEEKHGFMVLDLSERVGVHSLNPLYQLVPNATRKNTFPLSFPSSVEVLTNLRTLRLDHCKLADVSFLGKLKGLEILSLYGSSITQLPNEFGDLVNLRPLDLSFCGYLQKIPENLISRLVQLEELYTGWSFRLWQLADGSAEGSGQASLSELMSLPQLNILCVEVSTLLAFPENFDLPSIHKFEITTGIPNGMKHMLQFSKELTMFCASKVILKSIFDVEGGLNHLKTLEITANDEITYFIDEVLHSDAPLVLGSLEKLHLRTFKKLFSLSVRPIKPAAQNLCQLDNLQIVECHRLTRIIGEEPEGISANVQNGHVLFPNLRAVHIGSCRNLKNLFSVTTARSLGKLEELKVNDMPNLVEFISNEESEREEENNKIIVLPELKVLRITKSGNVERLCTEAFCMDLPSLEEFVLVECPKMADTVKRGLGSASNLLKAEIEEQHSLAQWHERFSVVRFGSWYRYTQLVHIQTWKSLALIEGVYICGRLFICFIFSHSAISFYN